MSDCPGLRRQVRGRSERLKFAATFRTIYDYRVLYPRPSVYFPIVRLPRSGVAASQC